MTEVCLDIPLVEIEVLPTVIEMEVTPSVISLEIAPCSIQVFVNIQDVIQFL